MLVRVLTIGYLIIIVRHGLSESEAFQIEASLIDTLTYCGLLLSNIAGGHNSIEKGLMTSEEIVRLYNAQPLNQMGADCILLTSIELTNVVTELTQFIKRQKKLG